MVPHPAAIARILVADSDAAARAVCRATFAPDRYDIVEAADGREALTKALVHPPSLLLTELSLPHIDGFALCEILRRDRATATVPILVVTAETRPPVLDRARNAGVDGVLIKPAVPDALLAEVERLLLKSSALRERGKEVVERATAQLKAAADVMALARRAAKAPINYETTTPPVAPPHLFCPSCDQPLLYEQSHVGGVTKQREQWDDFLCPSCGLFQYRHRTRKLRRL